MITRRMQSLRRTAFGALRFAALSLLLAPVYAAVLDCELNGQSVNPNNGSTTAGKTGIMKCVDRETRKFVREEEYRNGEPIGHRKSVDYLGNTAVGTYNAQRNREGEYRELDAAGNLTTEERYVNGALTGIQTYFHKNRQVRRRSFNEPGKGSLASIEYNERGQLVQLRCADKPLMGEDRALCGFEGRIAEVTFHNARGEVTGQARYENGKRLAMSTLATAGAGARSEEVQGDRRIVRQHHPEGPLRLETVMAGAYRLSERELAKSGQPVRETRWQEGRTSEETLWYLNGQPKSKTRWERDGQQVLVKIEEFWDNGTLKARSVRDERRGFVGLQQTYAESGVLESEVTYDKGTITRRRSYKDGRLVLDEEYFEDGSRKSTRKPE
jgi:antitoxin component YwqK of YwqJK toxin-antitoxin module